MQWVMRIVCVAYAIFLTMLLWTADPSRLIGFHGDLPRVLRVLLPIAHVLSFLVLAGLVLMTRWPMPRWGIMLLLAVYGGITEFSQRWFPPRTPRWADWCQDLIGIAVGAACCWAVAMLAGMYTGARRRQTNAPSPAAEEWTGIQNVMQRSTLSERSWWN